MIETRSTKIGDCTYTVQQLGAKRGGRVLVRLLKLVGGAAGDLVTGDTIRSHIGSVVANLANTISEEDYDWLCGVFADQTFVSLPNGKEPQLSQVFDMHFAGNYMAMIQWLWFSLEVNYSGFLDALNVEQGEATESARQVSKVVVN